MKTVQRNRLIGIIAVAGTVAIGSGMAFEAQGAATVEPRAVIADPVAGPELQHRCCCSASSRRIAEWTARAPDYRD